jgi:hypothetical protein
VDDICFFGGEQSKGDKKTENTEIEGRALFFSQEKESKMIQPNHKYAAQEE